MGNSNLNRKRGKRNEKAIATRLNGKRVGILQGEDITGVGNFSIEAKSRVKSVAHNFMAQAVRNSPSGKMPLVIIHRHKDNRDNDLVVIRLKDWEIIYGKL